MRHSKEKTLATFSISLAIICLLTACDSTKKSSQNDTNNNTVTTTSYRCPASEYGNHKWMPPSCVEPAKCFWCDAYKDEKLADHHNWNVYDSGLTKCQDCSILQDDWMRQQGLDEQSDATNNNLTSDETFDNNTTIAKIPKVEGNSFNLTDKEFIDWMNDTTNSYVGYSDLSDGEMGDNTLYSIEFDDETGGIILNHGDNGKYGNICAIMVWFDDWSTSAAIASYIGSEIDSDFSADDAVYPLIDGNSYTKGDLTVMLLDLDDDFVVATLAPNDFFEDILS